MEHKFLAIVVLAFVLTSTAVAQQFQFHAPPISDRRMLSDSMAALAKEVLAVYTNDDHDKFLDTLFRLQTVAGEHPSAIKSLVALRQSRQPTDPVRSAWVNVQFEVYSEARVRQQESGNLSFKEAFEQSFREVFGRLSDQAAALAIRALGADQSRFVQALKTDLEGQLGKDAISLDHALRLIRDYQVEDAYHTIAPLITSLVAEDDARRYDIQENVPVKTPDGGVVCALIVRPRNGLARLPALLEFTIYANADQNIRFSARPAASRGYVGVEGLVRGKGCSPDKPMPYERDASDAAALVDWISVQPWSDGRVGMYGGSYSGFTSWAATKRVPKALKAIAVGAAAAPGIDVPMEGNVFWNFIYPWPFYTTNVKGLDDATYNDSGRWNRLNHDWYMSGRAYRDLDKIDGTPNPIFDSWIAHPRYDEYWQNMIPYREEFSQIKIPVLQTAGYYSGGPGAAVYYFSQHYQYNPRAEHYLVIGPYDHPGAQHGTARLLGGDSDELDGYKLDPIALVDLDQLRFEWFDYVFKGAPKPALLRDKVNYEVTGANVWKHAPTLASMSNQKLRFHLSTDRVGEAYRLSERKPAKDAFIKMDVDLVNRLDVDRERLGGGVLDRDLDTANAIEFISDPLTQATEMSGLFFGQLDFVTDKKDFDFEIDVYEKTPKGEYMQLAPYWARASFVGHLNQRRLLTPGKRQRLGFRSVRLMSRQLQPGSRLVVVLSVIKEPGRQINFGTGRDVSDETVADSKTPLHIKWYSDSYVDMPVWNPQKVVVNASPILPAAKTL